MKTCSRCKTEKSLNEFAIYKNKHFSWCRPCQNESAKEYQAKNPEKVKAQSKRYRENHPDYAASNSRRWRTENPGAYLQKLKDYRLRKMAEDPLWEKKRSLRSKYKITLKKYEEMYRAQNGGCAICGKLNVSGRMLAVDHNHATGIVRGLLCSRCNMALGLFREDESLFARAVDYLKTHQMVPE